MKIAIPPRKLKATVTFRPDEDVTRMLERASKDHPILSRIVNECIRRQLSSEGYSRKKDEAR